jgi:uncharacterized tellurite resistance protein B-like protein
MNGKENSENTRPNGGLSPYRQMISGTTIQPSRSDMFDALHRLLTGLDHPHRAAEQNDSAFALAVLLIEVARSSDNRVENREEGVIERVLIRRFGLEQNEVIRLVKAAEEGAIQATDLFHFTQVVVNNFSNEERIGVIEMLWEVAYAERPNWR